MVSKVTGYLLTVVLTISSLICNLAARFRGTQRHFLENMCSEGDWRSGIFGTFVVKFLACLLLLGFSIHPPRPQNGIIAHFNEFLHLKSHLEFSGAFFQAAR